MKLEIPVPVKKLQWFQEKLGLAEDSLQTLDSYRSQFAQQKERFSRDIYQYFYDIPETRVILERGGGVPHNPLIAIWQKWFELVFREGLSQKLLGYLWRSGLRHVESDIDQRFINLGYTFVRQFCQDVATIEVPSGERENVLVELDKLIDFCVLIESHAFITATSQCDMEVVKGISHQVRNPLTVIGGNILRLKRKVTPGSPLEEIYDTILNENRRLEKMVVDVGVYSDMLQKEPQLEEVFLKDLVADAQKRLGTQPSAESSDVRIELDPDYPAVIGDASDLTTMFYYLLQNSLEAADSQEDIAEITSRTRNTDSPFLQIEIFNEGRLPNDEEIPNLFVPFYSSKPLGTGLGLSIARLAARKSHGDVVLEPKPTRGVRCTIRLPLPQREGSGAYRVPSNPPPPRS